MRAALAYARYQVWDRQLVGSCCIAQGAQLGARDDLEGRDGGTGREAHGGGEVCIHMADSSCCSAETNTTL